MLRTSMPVVLLVSAALVLAACSSMSEEPAPVPVEVVRPSAPAPAPVMAPPPEPMPSPMPEPEPSPALSKQSQEEMEAAARERAQAEARARAESEMAARQRAERDAMARAEADMAEADMAEQEIAEQEMAQQEMAMESAPPPPIEAEARVMAGPTASGACIDSSGYGTSFDCVDLFFGTNRNEEPSDAGQVLFGGRAAGASTLGVVTVTVPIERLNMPGSPVKKLSNANQSVTMADRDEYFAIWGWDEQDPASFKRLVGAELAAATEYENSALVFVHGFNVTFRSAAFRAAQMKFDMDYDGPTFFFSWPANGSTLEYLSDQDDADISVAPLTDFLQLVRESVGEDTKIYLVAHSMGTRLAAQAINRLSLIEGSDEPFFERSLFAAGDLDRELFRRWIEPARGLVGELTIYTSSDDKAVSFSRFLRTPGFGSSGSEDAKSRIGLIDQNLGPSIFDEAMTIDITDVNTGILSNFFGVNHADYVESEVTIADLEALLRGAPFMPEARNGNFVRQCFNGRPYWKYIKAGGTPDNSCVLPF